ncbi:MAG: peptidylprolyl isomerase [Porphyromonas sp.]|nr:peptidylprolyl isomerase [Porphyromonas sp.]
MVKYIRQSFFALLSCCAIFVVSRGSAVAQQGNSPLGTRVEIETTKGKFTVLLYDDTPLHKEQFLKLVREGQYVGTIFHRVINMFMVQGGNLTARNATKDTNVSVDTLETTIASEFFPDKYFHKRGALAAARIGDEGNPEKKSSGSQFYIVTGTFYTDLDLNQLQEKQNRTFTPEQREAYKTVGGAPWLDGAYTVFGEVVEGMSVIEKIEQVETDSTNRPLKNILIKKTTIL